MEKLAQITIDNSLNVIVNCQVDQSLLARNFVTIVNALKELKQAQALSQSKINEFASLSDKLNSLSQKIERVEKGGSNSNKQVSNPSHTYDQNISSNLAALTKRVDKNQSTILDNIKDINLLNKEVADAKNQIQELKKRLLSEQIGALKSNEPGKSGYGLNDLAQNLSKQLKQSQDNFKQLANRLNIAEDNIQKLQKELKELLQRKSGDHSNSGGSHTEGAVSDREFQDLKKDLRQKIQVINKKINNLQSDSNRHEQDITYLKDSLDEREENNNHGDQNQNTKNSQSMKSDLLQLRKRIEEINQREKKDVKALQEQINALKLILKGMKNEKIDSKTSLQQQNQRSHRKSTINKDRDQLNDKLNDLILKVAYLQKLLAGSKNSLTDQKNPEKLPSIHKPKRRDPNLTVYQEKSGGVSRKDLAELKAQLQAWLKSLLEQNQNRQNFEGLQLKLQEMKRNLERKADAEGTKKGFSFLENKITQLYLFLTEPEAQDAMIVRKGFNCLSCSKKVEKLRGKLGPHLNWNNMTATNYSPPRVGYSKPMGDNSIDKEDDL